MLVVVVVVEVVVVPEGRASLCPRIELYLIPEAGVGDKLNFFVPESSPNTEALFVLDGAVLDVAPMVWYGVVVYGEDVDNLCLSSSS